MKKLLKLIYKNLPFKKEIFSVVKLIGTPPASIYKHLHFQGKFKINIENLYFWMNHYGFLIENEIFWNGLQGRYEKVSLDCWINLSKISHVILDVGANTGLYSLVSKTVNPAAEVYAFEPVHRVFTKLQENCELNQYKINCCQLALSNYDGKGIIYDTPTDHVYSVTVNKNLLANDSSVIETKIITCKLASFIKDRKIPHIDLIKIDVETHEAEVLEGFEEYLQLMKPSILLEILNLEIGEKVEKIVENKGYLYFKIDEINSPEKVDFIMPNSLINSTNHDSYGNYLLCTKEIAKQLKLIND
ncbi:FkbM family methyltransferase [Phormidium pseudopriestleyi FRX01]|uniref:FkbM family methyltransferase n=1 Tax=Phormidium pseudopriestleyi FRX01 TaxID=1759528 RepID=A0ABS3FLS2_9CYAN|nr:FkbM family methyltransferase [Phormidium pseudopriestleyi]MBO0347852.1 FkbM family methyltransferase [Phormidium pseudopriestleyi FRX01]